MSLNSSAIITIDGQQFRQFKYLSLLQPIDGHHEFSVHIYTDWLLALGRTAISLLGKEVLITINAVLDNGRTEGLLFNGIVSNVTMGGTADGNLEYCIVNGGCPTILMDNNPDIHCYEQQKLSVIIQEHLKACKGFVNEIKINPATDSLLRYTVQYRESSYRFIRRLAEQRGEWFFYNGQQLFFGKYKPKEWNVNYPLNVQEFSINAGISPGKGIHKNYEYRKGCLYTEEWPSLNNGSSYVQQACSASNQLYNQPSLYRSRDSFSSQAQSELSRLVAIYEQHIVANRVTVKGKSGNAGVRVGDIINLSNGKDKRLQGSFLLTKVHHHYSGNGTYYNLFEGIAAETAMPKVVLDNSPYCESQRAIIVDNNDPKGLGRVKVRFDWQTSESSPWIRIVMPYGGPGKGVYFVPEINEEVWVAFEGSNPELPYVLGAQYNGRETPEWNDSENNIKVIKTRSGHTIQFNDSAGKEQISIHNKVGNSITFDSWDKSISIKSPESIYLEAKQLFINTQENIAICAGESFSCYTGKDLNLQATELLQLRAESENNLVAEKHTIHAKEVECTAGKIKLESTKENLEIICAAQIDIQSKEKISLF
ncbi:hypothetical protein DVR12_06475 [Chitinophaga silvatica]|uniref:Gp5/Type VI secretion system Vgr protein OB-fold domain-containing protein n=1 Tax=Chitinophaga silvatica TaxID=2282649 RepID=A0A3E1YED3_9BACT|nr:phage baseplate assembly protein V [Chitinophaga silvatica]RFS24834.1 hypothetical protein DVR12_06475 [Chitinophaga silvatica]